VFILQAVDPFYKLQLVKILALSPLLSLHNLTWCIQI